MKIPYGLSNFADIRNEGYFYIDKTPFLPRLEAIGARYLFFLRPRRFGKSLWLSLLQYYYDLGRAAEFDKLFGGLWIHENPTPERNRYLVLSLDFSQVATDRGSEALLRTFLEAVKLPIRTLLLRYRDQVPVFGDFIERLDSYRDAESLLTALTETVSITPHKLYVLIDEYDNFANNLLSAGAEELYESIVLRTGFVRSFYAALKRGTQVGAIGRIFITGVSPILLDDLSSGFNIGSHISQLPALNTLAGFTHADVERAVTELLTARPRLAEQPELADREALLGVLEQYYNGYRFSEHATERVFNSDMVLYFLEQLERTFRYPTYMLDHNIRTDYGRLQHIGTLTGTGSPERRALMETILTQGAIDSSLVQQFGMRSLSSQEQFLSFLYYLGLLTMAPEPRGATGLLRLEIPNRVIRELQWEHLALLLKDQENIHIDTRELSTVLAAMAVEGDIQPFLDLFHERVVKAMGVKDLRQLGEKQLKLMLLTFISLSRVFYPLSEKEFAQGYCDLFLGVSRLVPAARYAWMLEIKYLPTDAKARQVEAAIAQAHTQLERYASDANLVELLTLGRELSAGTLVFVGAKKVLFRPWSRAAEPSVAPAPRNEPARPRARTARPSASSKPRPRK